MYLSHRSFSLPCYSRTHAGAERHRQYFFSSRRRHTRFDCDWSSDVCSSDLGYVVDGRQDTVNPTGVGTKAAAHYVLDVAAGQSYAVPLRLFSETDRKSVV